MSGKTTIAAKITVTGFLSEFMERHKKMPERPFCWVLGSGASVQSGIPTGGTLAIQWLKEIHERENFERLPLEEWATAKNLGINGFNFANAASFYPFIYQRRFRDFKELGYAFLEEAMDKSEPSYGYSVLAQIMTQTPHKVAVTTNFDTLIANAISIYTRAFPLVCGHEFLSGFIRPGLNRPVIAKLHRDLLFNPKSAPEEIAKLPPEWEAALTIILDHNTPIVIGYGGNDGSLMGLLKSIPPIKGGVFWCHQKDHEPSQAIQEVVRHHHGRMVAIEGFDELMLRFAAQLQLPSPLPELKKTHDLRVENLTKQLTDLEVRLKKGAENEKWMEEFSSKARSWRSLSNGLIDIAGMLAFTNRLQRAASLDEREAIYRSEAQARENSPWFWNDFGDFLWKSRRTSRKQIVVSKKLFSCALTTEQSKAATKSS